MFHLKKMTAKDFHFAVKLANTMEWNMTDDDFKFNMDLEPDGCFILRDESKAIGVATCIGYGKIGWFGNLIVEEQHRGQGAGTFLVTQAVNYLRRGGADTVGLYAYPHLVDFYSSVGFKPDADFTVFKADRILSKSSSDSVAKNKALKKESFARVVELDAACFGGSRERLLKRISANRSNKFYAIESNEEIVGFAAAKVYVGMAEIGPLVCDQGHIKLTKDLLRSMLSGLKGSKCYMCLPSTEERLAAVAVEFGFKKKFAVVRMFLGTPVKSDCIYATESLERG